MDTITQTVNTWMVDSRAIERAMVEIGHALATEMELCSHPSEGDDPEPYTEDIAAALREPVSLASAFYDLARRLNIDPPQVVLEAVGKRPYRKVYIAPPY